MSENPYEIRGEADIGRPQANWLARKLWRPLLFVAVAAFVLLLLSPLIRTTGARTTAWRAQCMNNLHQIGLALQLYQSRYHQLPPPVLKDADGKPLHSWRTLIMPFLDSATVKVDLKKPWNDPANERVRRMIPAVYRCPADGSAEGNTTYLACLTKDGQWPVSGSGKGPLVMVADISPDNSVPWMAPEDVDQDRLKNIDENWGAQHKGNIFVLMTDGSIRKVPIGISAEERRALMEGADDGP